MDTRQIIKTTAVILSLVWGMGTAIAQPRHGTPGRDSLQAGRPRVAQAPNPQKRAKEMTDRLKDELQLTDKQYQKIYKLHLKELKNLQENRPLPAFAGEGGRRPRPNGGMPPRNGRMMPAEGDDDMPPMMMQDQERPQRPDLEQLRKEQAEKMKKLAEKKDKKMKKILTGDQYARWKAMPPERPERPQGRRPRPEAEGQKPAEDIGVN